MTAIETESTVTCPRCGHQKTETMPTDACQFFYDARCYDRTRAIAVSTAPTGPWRVHRFKKVGKRRFNSFVPRMTVEPRND